MIQAERNTFAALCVIGFLAAGCVADMIVTHGHGGATPEIDTIVVTGVMTGLFGWLSHKPNPAGNQTDVTNARSVVVQAPGEGGQTG